MVKAPQDPPPIRPSPKILKAIKKTNEQVLGAGLLDAPNKVDAYDAAIVGYTGSPTKGFFIYDESKVRRVFAREYGIRQSSQDFEDEYCQEFQKYLAYAGDRHPRICQQWTDEVGLTPEELKENEAEVFDIDGTIWFKE